MTPEQRNRITDLAEELGTYLDDESKLRTAIMSTLKTAYRNHQVHISPASTPPSPGAPSSTVQARASPEAPTPSTTVQSATQPIRNLLQETGADNTPDTRQSRSTSSSRKIRPGPRLLSPSVARARYRKMLNAAAPADDVSVYSEFLTPSDYDSDWDRIAVPAATSETTSIPAQPKTTNIPASARTTDTSVQPKTTNIPARPKTTSIPAQKTKHISTHQGTKNMPAQSKTTKMPRRSALQQASMLPTPPQSDEVQPTSSPVQHSQLNQSQPTKASPYKDPFGFRPPGAPREDDIYTRSRKRAGSFSSISSESSLESDTSNLDHASSSAPAINSTHQALIDDERRYRRARKARRLGLPIPPPTPPPLPPSTAFPTAKGHTIPGRDLKPQGRKAQEFLGNSGKLGQDQAPHIRKAMRLNLSETPVVDELWYPSEAIRYDQKDAIIASLIENITKRASVAQSAHAAWHTTFTLTPPASASKKVQKKKWAYDFNFRGTNSALRGRLASAFGIQPFSPIAARMQLEKTLQPLVLANRSSFKQLEGCAALKSWEGWKVVLGN